jgi:hypothetical protein
VPIQPAGECAETLGRSTASFGVDILLDRLLFKGSSASTAVLIRD